MTVEEVLPREVEGRTYACEGGVRFEVVTNETSKRHREKNETSVTKEEEHEDFRGGCESII